MALKGIKVIELAGLAPAPFCGMILSDFGATVIRVDRLAAQFDADCVANGKKSLALNLKHKDGINIFKKLAKNSDVLIEPFRKGVMESLGIGPEILLQENPRLIYARLTGYGQSGIYSKRAGHDVNFLGLTGLLSLFGRAKENPIFPANLAADFGGGGLMCALGIVLALFERNQSGEGQVIDCSMVEGTAYLGTWLYRSQSLPIWGNARGENILDTGTHFYETYKTKDGKYVAVGAIEPHFYANLLKGLGLDEKDVDQLHDFQKSKQIFAAKFLEKTQDEWCEIFDKSDACVSPILSLDEAPHHPQNIERKAFVKCSDGKFAPAPAPRLSRTPGQSKCSDPSPIVGQHTSMILQDLGYSDNDIQKFQSSAAVGMATFSKL